MAKYEKWTPQKIKEGREEVDTGDGDFLKLQTGRNTLRFLPPKKGGNGTPIEKALQHFMKLPGQERALSIVCPRTIKKPCPVCEKMEELQARGNPADYETAKEYKAKPRFFANVVDRRQPDKGVQVFAFGKTVAEQLYALADNEEAGGDFTDPEAEGFDVIIEKKGQGLDTEYTVFPARKSTPLGNDEWLDSMHDLRKWATPLPREEIMKKLKGAAAKAGVQIEEVEEPPARLGKGNKGRTRTVADDTDTADD